MKTAVPGPVEGYKWQLVSFVKVQAPWLPVEAYGGQADCVCISLLVLKRPVQASVTIGLFV